MRADTRYRPARRLAALILLLALLVGCTSAVPTTATPIAATTPPAIAPSPTSMPRQSASPPTPTTASPTAERARATFGTIVIAVTYIPTPTPYPPPLLATATAASVGFPADIAAAEAEGAIHPRLDPPPKAPDTFANATGTGERKCVPVEGSSGIRSGGFAAGPFNRYYEQWQQYGTAKVWWVPEHPLRGVNIVVRAIRLETPTETVRQEIMPNSPDFFPSLVALPSGGTWLLIATGGPNWGCFVLTLPA